MFQIDINDYDVEKECVYQGEKYCVRDNGAVLRFPKENTKPRLLDNKWTFGKVGNHGYLYLASKGIHRIVATAFHGENLSKEYIVDHIDTNKQNNRPENLRWITKEANIMNNPNTRDKIQYITGCSIEELKENNWEELHKYTSEKQNTSWMRPTTKKEAENFHKRQEQWLNKKPKMNEENQKLYEQLMKISNKQNKNKKLASGMGEWVFNPPQAEQSNLDLINNYNEESFKESLTANAYQTWETPTKFPCCPPEAKTNMLEEYLLNLEVGKILCQSELFTSEITKFEYNAEKAAIIVQTVQTNKESVKPWHITKISVQGNICYHSLCYRCFGEDGADKYYTIACGREWAGGDVFDDFC